jgi:hypothetical protein
MGMVLAELDRLGVPYREKKGDATDVSCDSIPNRPY